MAQAPETPAGRPMRRLAPIALGAVLLVALAGYGLLPARGGGQRAEVDEIEQWVQYRQGRAVSAATAEEFPLGRFQTTVFREELDLALRLDFQLALAVSREDAARFDSFLRRHRHRLRNEVLHIVNRAATQDLTDPALMELKGRIAAAVNDAYGRPVVLAAVFGDYSCDEQ